MSTTTTGSPEKTSLERATEIAGSISALARELHVTRAAVWQWGLPGRRVPAEHCPTIERLTFGRVRCEQLRPDVDWAYLRGARESVTSEFDASRVTVRDKSGVALA